MVGNKSWSRGDKSGQAGRELIHRTIGDLGILGGMRRILSDERVVVMA